MKKSVCIIDDHPLIMLGYKTLLETVPDLSYAGEATSLEDAKALISTVKPDVAVIDIALAQESGLSLVEYIHNEGLHTSPLCMSMHAEEVYAEKAMLAGALGYVNKQSAARVFLEAVRCVAEGRLYFSTKAQKLLLGRLRGEIPPANPVAALTSRETEILRYIGLGLTKNEISEKIKRSANTVEAHRTNIKRKLSIDNNNELIRFAISVFPEINPQN